MNSVNAVVPTQMLTPINSLPLKTSSQQETDIDDPLIQNVLKEFEEEYGEKMPHSQQHLQQQPPQQQPVQQPVVQPQYIHTQQPAQLVSPDSLQYNKPSAKKLFNIDVAKKAALITLILFALQYTNLLKVITSRLPESMHSYISGKELLLNILLTFAVIYSIFYLELI